MFLRNSKQGEITMRFENESYTYRMTEDRMHDINDKCRQLLNAKLTAVDFGRGKFEGTDEEFFNYADDDSQQRLFVSEDLTYTHDFDEIEALKRELNSLYNE